MSAKRIKNIYKDRQTTYTVGEIDKCLDSVASKLSQSKSAITKEIQSYLTDNNYVATKPSLWASGGKANTSRNEFIQEWSKDVANFGNLNANITKKRVASTSLRVCTFNVHYWFSPDNKTFLFDGMANVIDSTQADVVCLQEVVLPLDMKAGTKVVSTDGWTRDDLVDTFEKMGYTYHHHCASDNQNHIGPGAFFGNAVFSKFPIKSVRSQDLQPYMQSRCFAAIEVDILGYDPVTVVSVHLDVFDVSEKTRLKEVQQMVKALQSAKGSVIVCGDFNSLKRSDYTIQEWDWLRINNQDTPLHTMATDEMSKDYREAFDDGELKYTVWTSRRVDYVWHRGNLAVEKANVFYTDASDHFPLVVDFQLPTSTPDIPPVKTLESVKGKFKSLLWTHNTPYETLYKMMTGEYIREFRCCEDDGTPFKRGAQFRYGLDSQYGDIIFIMKPDGWWKKLKGVIPADGPSKLVDHPVMGHFFKNDFIQYTSANIGKVDKLMEGDALMYDYRPRTAQGSGLECKRPKWEISWCNLQLHSGSNVGMDHVEVVMFPWWMIGDQAILEKLSQGDEFIKLVSNNLPVFDDGTVNILNGKFVPYGSDKMVDHYQFFRQIAEANDPAWIAQWYPDIDDTKYRLPGSTARNPFPHGNSSRLALSADAFESAEKIYIKLLQLIQKN